MGTVFRMLGFVALPVTLWALTQMVRQWRRQHRFTVPRLVLPMATAAGLVLVYSTLLDVELPRTRTWVPLLIGIGGGVVVGRRAHVAVHHGEFIGMRSMWGLAVWAGAYCITQLLALSGAAGTTAILAIVFLATGVTVGEHGWLLMRRGQLLPSGGAMTTAAGGTAVVLALLLVVLTSPPPAHATAGTVEISDTQGRGVEGLSVEVRGTNVYYADALEVFVENETGETQRIVVPVGSRFVPDDPAVQTMLTAGGETIVAPPGASRHPIKAFCGEQHDAIPMVTNTFSSDGRVSGALLGTLQNIHEAGSYDPYAQDAVWSHTDGLDVSRNESALSLVATSARPDPGDAGVAGVAVLLLALGFQWVVQQDEEPDTLILSGSEAREWLVGAGADWPTPADRVTVEDREYLRPPSGIPDKALGFSYDTKTGGHPEGLIPRDDFTIIRQRNRPAGPAQWDEWHPEGSKNPPSEISSLFASYELGFDLREIDGAWRVVAPQNLSDRADASVFETITMTDPTTSESIEVIDTDKPVIIIGVPRTPAAPPKPLPQKQTPSPPQPVPSPPVPSTAQDAHEDVSAESQPAQPGPEPPGTADGGGESAAEPPTRQTRPSEAGADAEPPFETASPPGFDRVRFANAAAIGVTGMSSEGQQIMLGVVKEMLPETVALPDLSNKAGTRRFFIDHLSRARPEVFARIKEHLGQASAAVSWLEPARNTVMENGLQWARDNRIVESVLKKVELVVELPKQALPLAEAAVQLDGNDFALLEKTLDDLSRAAGVTSPPSPF